MISKKFIELRAQFYGEERKVAILSFTKENDGEPPILTLKIVDHTIDGKTSKVEANIEVSEIKTLIDDLKEFEEKVREMPE